MIENCFASGSLTDFEAFFNKYPPPWSLINDEEVIDKDGYSVFTSDIPPECIQTLVNYVNFQTDPKN